MNFIFFLFLIKRSEKQTILNRIMKITNLNHKFDSLVFDLETKTIQNTNDQKNQMFLRIIIEKEKNMFSWIKENEQSRCKSRTWNKTRN